MIPLNVRRLTKEAFIKEMQKRSKLKQGKVPKLRPSPTGITKSASLGNSNNLIRPPQIIRAHSTEIVPPKPLRPPGIRPAAVSISSNQSPIMNKVNHLHHGGHVHGKHRKMA